MANESCGHSPLVLEEQNTSKVGESVGAVGERAEDRFAVSDGERDHLAAALVCALEGFGGVVEALLAEASGEVEHETVGNLESCEEHAFDSVTFGSEASRRSVTAGASALVLVEQDRAKLGELVGTVAEEAKDCFAVVGFERDLGALKSPGVLQFVGDVEFPGVSEPTGELEDCLVRYGNACEEHAYDFARFGAA